MIEVKNLAQLDGAFEHVASRSEPVEGFHFAVNSLIRNAQLALYRDFPIDFVNMVRRNFNSDSSQAIRRQVVFTPFRLRSS